MTHIAKMQEQLMSKIVLASASPQRIELMSKLRITDFDVIPSNIDEELPDGLPPEEAVCTLALEKAKAVAAAVAPDTPVVIAADTMVYLNGSLLGKPADAADAKKMLRRLSGSKHSVYTGVALVQAGRYMTGVERTDVWFCELTDADMDEYIATGEPLDKAGANCAQGYAAAFISRIEGDFWNVVGLPLYRLRVMIKEFGV